MAGTADPMQLPTLHHILDVVEMIVVEGLGTKSEIHKYYFRTYKPDPKELTTAFSAEESDASFDAFAALNLH